MAAYRRRASRKAQTKRDAEWVSKTDIADYYRCPYTFWLMHTGQISREDAFGETEARLVAAGIDHEQEQLARMPELPERLTHDEISAIATFVYNGPTLENPTRKLVGRPDGIEILTRAPVEIKLRIRPVAFDKLELAFYWLLLEHERPTQLTEPYGWMSLLLGEPVRTTLSAHHIGLVETLIQEVREARKNGVAPRVCDCFTCRRRPEVLALYEAGADVGLVIGVGPSRMKTLARIGVTTVQELCDVDPMAIAERLRAFDGSKVSAGMVRRWQDHSRALRDRVVVRFSNERFLEPDYIVLDLEYDVWAWKGHLWFIGTLLFRDGKYTIAQALCRGEAERTRALQNLVKMLAQHPSLPIVTWGGTAADIPHLESAARKHGVRVKKHLARHVDLYRVAHRSVRLPVAGLDLKTLSSHVGVKRSSSIENGLQAGFRYEQYRAEKVRTEKARLREELFTYNRDDLLALHAVTEYLKTV